jgi:hypothetical protein
MNNTKDQIPEIDLKLETKTVESKIVYAPFIMVETPYMILSDSDGTRRIWTRNKKKIVLYYLYKITRIEWFIKKYNEQPR